MSNNYGLEIYNQKGEKTLSVTDRMGRFLGKFTVPFVPKNSTREFIFTIPENHRGLGEIFLWYNPLWKIEGGSSPGSSDTIQTPDVTNIIRIESTRIVVNTSVKAKVFEQFTGQEAFVIWYGVF